MPQAARAKKNYLPIVARYALPAAATAVAGPFAGGLMALAEPLIQTLSGHEDCLVAKSLGAAAVTLSANLNGLAVNRLSARVHDGAHHELAVAYRQALEVALQQLSTRGQGAAWFAAWKRRFQTLPNATLAELAAVDDEALWESFDGKQPDAADAYWPLVVRALEAMAADDRRGKTATLSIGKLDDPNLLHLLRDELPASFSAALDAPLADHQKAFNLVLRQEIKTLRSEIQAKAWGPDVLPAIKALESVVLRRLDEIQAEMRAIGAEHGEKLDTILDRLDQPPLIAPATIEREIQRLNPAPADFAGRERQRDRVVEAIRDPSRTSVVVIHGIGGAGKTTLARKAADILRPTDRFPGGEYRLDMRGLDNEQPALDELLRGLLSEIGVVTQASGRALLGIYRDRMAKTPTLVLADNARDAAQVKDLVPLAPSALIVTAREDIKLRGATHVRLSAWSRSEWKAATELLKSVCDGERDEDLTKDEAREVVQACGGLPIAVRAAGLLLADPHQPSVEEVLADIRDRRRSLNDGEADVDATLQLSVEALERRDPDLVQAWRRLSVFPGDFDSVAAATVMNCQETEATTALHDLMNHSLLEPGDASRRYRLHDLYRPIAANGLNKADNEAAKLAFAVYFGKLVTACCERFEQKGGQAAALEAFDRERVSIETGWETAHEMRESSEVARLALLDFGARKPGLLYIRLAARVLVEWARAGQAAAHDLGDERAEARATVTLCAGCRRDGRYRDAVAHGQRALELARSCGDKALEAGASGNLGNAYNSLGKYREAIEHHETQLELARELEDRAGEARATGNLGNAYHSLGEYRKAIEHYEKDLSLSRELKDRAGEAVATGNLGVAYHSLGEHRKAIEHHEKHLNLARELEDRAGEARALWNRGLAFHADGQINKAIDSAEEGLKLARQLEMPQANEAREALIARWKAERARKP